MLNNVIPGSDPGLIQHLPFPTQAVHFIPLQVVHLKPLRLRNTNHLNTLPRIKISPLSSSLALSRHAGPDPASHSFPVILNLIQDLPSAAPQPRNTRLGCYGTPAVGSVEWPSSACRCRPPASHQHRHHRPRHGISTRLFFHLLESHTANASIQHHRPRLSMVLLSIPVPLTKPLATPTH